MAADPSSVKTGVPASGDGPGLTVAPVAPAAAAQPGRRESPRAAASIPAATAVLPPRPSLAPGLTASEGHERLNSRSVGRGSGSSALRYAAASGIGPEPRIIPPGTPLGPRSSRNSGADRDSPSASFAGASYEGVNSRSLGRAAAALRQGGVAGHGMVSSAAAAAAAAGADAAGGAASLHKSGSNASLAILAKAIESAARSATSSLGRAATSAASASGASRKLPWGPTHERLLDEDAAASAEEEELDEGGASGDEEEAGTGALGGALARDARAARVRQQQQQQKSSAAVGGEKGKGGPPSSASAAAAAVVSLGSPSDALLFEMELWDASSSSASAGVRRGTAGEEAEALASSSSSSSSSLHEAGTGAGAAAGQRRRIPRLRELGDVEADLLIPHMAMRADLSALSAALSALDPAALDASPATPASQRWRLSSLAEWVAVCVAPQWRTHVHAVQQVLQPFVSRRFAIPPELATLQAGTRDRIDDIEARLVHLASDAVWLGGGGGDATRRGALLVEARVKCADLEEHWREHSSEERHTLSTLLKAHFTGKEYAAFAPKLWAFWLSADSAEGGEDASAVPSASLSASAPPDPTVLSLTSSSPGHPSPLLGGGRSRQGTDALGPLDGGVVRSRSSSWLSMGGGGGGGGAGAAAASSSPSPSFWTGQGKGGASASASSPSPGAVAGTFGSGASPLLTGSGKGGGGGGAAGGPDTLLLLRIRVPWLLQPFSAAAAGVAGGVGPSSSSSSASSSSPSPQPSSAAAAAAAAAASLAWGRGDDEAFVLSRLALGAGGTGLAERYRAEWKGDWEVRGRGLVRSVVEGTAGDGARGGRSQRRGGGGGGGRAGQQGKGFCCC